MDFFQHRYYRLNKTLMTICGQWPDQSSRAKCGRLIAIIFIIISQFVPQIVALVKYHEDPSIILDSTVPLLFEVILATKLITFILNAQKTEKVLNHIRRDWQEWARDEEVNFLHEYAEQGKKVIAVYTAAIYSGIFIYMGQPIVPKIIDVLLMNGTESGKFPYPVDYHYFDVQKYYCYFILYSFVCVYVAVTVIVASEILLVTYVQHVCGTFAALGHKLERIANHEKSVGKGETRYALEKRDMVHLASCINRHNDAIEFANLVETIYTWYLFFVLGFGMILFMAIGLQIFMARNDPEATAKFIIVAIVILLHFYIECYISQSLIDHSTHIGFYIQNSQWYSLSCKAQKYLQLITIRCRIPCQLSGGRLLTLSISTYGLTVKASLSYFTFIRSVQE